METLGRVVAAPVHGAEGLAARMAANAAEEPGLQPGQVPDLDENCGQGEAGQIHANVDVPVSLSQSGRAVVGD